MRKYKSNHRNLTAPQLTRAENDEHIFKLIRDILRVTQSCPKYEPVFASHNGMERVLLDIELDGNRYVLIEAPQTRKKSPSLSPREKEIVRMVAQGYQNKVIAVELNISLWTVCTHMRRVFAKLGVTSRASMVAELSDLIAPAKMKSDRDDTSDAAVINSIGSVDDAYVYRFLMSPKKNSKEIP